MLVPSGECSSDPYNVTAQVCGGTILSKNRVLTAAHCVCWPIFESHYNCTMWKSMFAFIGDHDIETKDEEQIIGIKSVIIHKKYQGI